MTVADFLHQHMGFLWTALILLVLTKTKTRTWTQL
jgi:hypothetical protein